MDNRNRKDKKKGTPLGFIVIIAAAIFSMLQENGFKLFSGAIPLKLLAVVAVFVIAAVVVVVAVKKSAAASKEAKTPFAHSHDRISNTAAGDDCTVDEHWKIQLDGFYKAGIIDRVEYQTLLKNHSERAANSGR